MSDNTTPMMLQYRKMKEQLPPGVILFFRLGDFYEMFYEDAKLAASLLNITLTKRQNAPMCGVPFHSVDGYIARLIKAGKKVAICEQTEDPATAKGVVKREIVRIVTPGTVLEDRILDSRTHNFLAAICKGDAAWGLAIIDVSTGLFWGEEASSPDEIADQLRKLSVRECTVAEQQADDPDIESLSNRMPSMQMTRCEDWTFDYDAAYDNMKRHFRVKSLEGFGCEGRALVVKAAGGVLYYVKEQLKRETGHICSFSTRSSSDYLVLDQSTCVHLDLVPTRGADSESLLKVLDVTKTAMGARKIRDWLLRPLINVEAICARHDAVGSFCDDRAAFTDLTESLASVRDLERLLGRMVSGMGNARDMTAIGQSLGALPAIRRTMGQSKSAMLRELAGAITPMPELTGLIAGAIVDEPPAVVKEGGMIRDGYRPELDELRHAGNEGREWIATFQAREQERTGIKSLKVRHTNVVGYYIEISKAQLANMTPPAEYQRRQTLVSAERFTTPELREYENKILGAKEKAIALEYELFLEIRNAVAKEATAIQATSDAIAQMDVLAALADRAMAFGYVRPSINGGDGLSIKDGRHPIIERMPDSERFVPNDTLLDGTSNQLMIITGPNMAGKSTYIRQVALIVIMAQMGSFVPAAEAEIGVVDRVFTRVGASDDIARGRSTFMVEMQETANILNNATPRSLIVLDEIGRGTSTFDGISIAWAVAEFLHNNERVKAKTLFATHYHELTDLAMTMPGIKNYNILVRESGNKVVFLRKIAPGASDKSYGIAVARLAGMPMEVIDRAAEILHNLEEGEFGETGQPKIAKHSSKRGKANANQLSLFM